MPRLDIDVAFDFRRDTPEGKDPDVHSKTLRRYHRLLWSKPLPSGAPFGLSDSIRGHYLHHRSTAGEFSLSSDTVIPTFRWHKLVQTQIAAPELEEFRATVYTMGGMMVFPAKRIDGKWTINQARGCTRQIGDRFDLTLECVRRYYNGDESPLSQVLTRYASFFEIFGGFRGYVEFFLLHDLVSGDFSTVKMFAPFQDFRTPAIPKDVDAYRAYKSSACQFIHKRNQRILSSGEASDGA